MESLNQTIYLIISISLKEFPGERLIDEKNKLREPKYFVYQIFIVETLNRSGSLFILDSMYNVLE